MQKLKIAMIGVRGIPATYGGVEKHVEELAVRLVGRGHHVTVFCRSFYTPQIKDYKGVKIIRLPTINQKHLEMIVHTVMSALYIAFKRFDIVHVHSIDPALVTPLRLFKNRRKIVVTSHGQAYRRDKWGRLAKNISKMAEKISMKYSDAIVSVSRTLKQYYKETYGRDIVYIPNGVEIIEVVNDDVLKKFGLTMKGYILFVGRLIPTKGCDFLIEAYNSLKTDLKLVIVGGSSHTDEYELKLKGMANENVMFAGYQYGENLWQLYAHCKLFVFPSEIEGLPIVLLEALSFGVPVVFSDIPENMEVAQGIAISFKNTDVNDLSVKIQDFLTDPSEGEELAVKARGVIEKKYNWDSIVDQTEVLYNSIL
ncbi:MAG: glycosyltransferase [Nitrospiraceae bacterium]|nr:MAG: glycosyltransferase [Nitrospiraceae bacterium]